MQKKKKKPMPQKYKTLLSPKLGVTALLASLTRQRTSKTTLADPEIRRAIHETQLLGEYGFEFFWSPV